MASAKSWVCHGGVNRRAPILPWDAPDSEPHVSPYEAQVAYLEHLRQVWEHRYPDAPLSNQEVVVDGVTPKVDTDNLGGYFVLVQQTIGPGFFDYPSQGIMGLAYDCLACEYPGAFVNGKYHCGADYEEVLDRPACGGVVDNTPEYQNNGASWGGWIKETE